MLRATPNFRSARGLVAACLAVLFSLSPLAPLAQALSALSSDLACCRGKDKCCHGKGRNKNPNGPAVSSSSCATDCGQVTLGGVSQTASVQLRVLACAPPSDTLSHVRAGEFFAPSLRASHDLWQRPPPSFPLA